ncbi:DUF6701 domain-containing protein [Sulfuricystis multivorans]|uniref:DUF6701 domain-containing protein n=1 Tax=Sulfuricystis multivorans TaxID=2211108 RepID=UPI0015585370|nr:DUF6701 domain-containing protein [Sulfuricystis multivorans]
MKQRILRFGRGLLRLAFVSALLGQASSAAAATLWVGGCGPGANYATIQAAVNAAANGDTIEICAGTYNEVVTVPTERDGLTIESATGNRPDVTIWHDNATLILKGSNLTLRHLTIRSNNGRGIVRGWTATPSAHRFENLDIRAKEEAIYVDTSTKITVKDVKASSSNNRGIFIFNATDGAHEFENIEVDARDEAMYVYYGGVSYKNIKATSQNQRAIFLHAYYDVRFENVMAKSQNGDGIHLDWSPNRRNVEFVDVESEAKGRAIWVYTAMAVKMTRVTAKSMNSDAIRLESTALGPHEFDTITVSGSGGGKWGIYSYTGGSRFENININGTGGGIFLRAHYPVTFSKIDITATQGRGIETDWAPSRQPLSFSDVVIHSKQRGFSLMYGGKVTMKNVTVENESEEAIILYGGVVGAHEFEKVKAVSKSNEALRTDAGGVSFKDLDLYSKSHSALYFEPATASPPMVFENVKARADNGRGIVGNWGAAYAPPSIVMRRLDVKSQGIATDIAQSAAVTIEDSTIESVNDHAIHLGYDAVGAHVLRNVTLFAGKNGVEMESGLGRWSSTSPLIDRVCVKRGQDGIHLKNWNTRRVRIQNSRFDTTAYGVDIESDWAAPANVTGSCFMKNTTPRAKSNSLQHRFDGNYWNGVPGGSVYSDGKVRDNATLGSCPVNDCSLTPAGLHHLRIETGGTGVTCQREAVSFKACADASCSALYTGGDATIDLAPAGQWYATASGGGALANPQTIPASGQLTLYLQQTTAATVSVIATPAGGPAPTGTPPVTCNGDTAAAPCAITFIDGGLIFTASNPGGEATIPSQVAGVPFSYYLRAVKSDKTTGACQAAVQGSRSVVFGVSCLDPATCATGGPYLQVNGGGPTQTLTFDVNGYTTSAVQFNYLDVGRIQLTASTTSSTGGGLAGSSNPFVVKPHHFELANIVCADGTSNPAANDATGAKFCRAGEDFKVEVSARSATNGVTPSFGKESAPESVKLTHTLIDSGAGNNPVPNGSFGPFGTKCGGAAANGFACGTFVWDEVGIIKLMPSIKDGDYLGAGDASGNESGNIGRFYPHHFETQVTNACGSFTYSGQPFPLTVTAKNLGGGTTQNYAGPFAKTVTLFDANGTAGAFSPASLAAGDFLAGEADKTTPPSVKFSFAAKPAAPATLKVRATDTDGVTSSGHTEGTTPIRSGRLRLVNYYGSELLKPRVEYRVEYWDGNRWAVNAADTCTSFAAANIATGGLAGPSVGALSGGIGFITFNTAPAGSYDIAANLNAAGSDTSCNAAHGGTAANQTWLQGHWSAACGGIPPWQQDPNARVRLGSPKAPYIYLRERY